MTDLLSTKALQHYEQVLAEAQALYTAPVLLPIEADGDLEVTNIEVGEHYESCEIGRFAHNLYLRVRATDLAAFFTELRRIADDGLGAIIDEREDKARAEMVECPGCRTKIAPDDSSCGFPRCERIAAQEAEL